MRAFLIIEPWTMDHYAVSPDRCARNSHNQSPSPSSIKFTRSDAKSTRRSPSSNMLAHANRSRSFACPGLPWPGTARPSAHLPSCRRQPPPPPTLTTPLVGPEKANWLAGGAPAASASSSLRPPSHPHASSRTRACTRTHAIALQSVRRSPALVVPTPAPLLSSPLVAP